MDSMEAARAAAQRGIALLDQHGPEGWRSKIDLEHLSIEDGYWCVLGQIYADAWRVAGRATWAPFAHGRDVLAEKAGIKEDSAEWHGFMAEYGFMDFNFDDPDDTEIMISVSTEDLDQAWTEALSA